LEPAQAGPRSPRAARTRGARSSPTTHLPP